jgi:hypothetical protein
VKTTTVLACALGVGVCGCVGFRPDPARAALPYARIHQRATNEFEAAEFFKPAETKTNDLTFALAPLILQQVNGAKEPVSTPDRFGTLSVSNGAAVLDGSRAAIYWEADTVPIREKAHARFSYAWCYSSGPSESGRGPRPNSDFIDRGGASLPLQGVRITLDAAGQPVIWEVLAAESGVKLFFVSQSLEEAALAEFGKPLPGRRYAIERSIEEAPDVVVARVIADSPVPAGPIVYLSAGTRSVSTLICRCMPAQAGKLVATATYDLMPFQEASTNLFIMRARVRLQEGEAFWPGDNTGGKRLERCLRLPEAFSRPHRTMAR